MQAGRWPLPTGESRQVWRHSLMVDHAAAGLKPSRPSKSVQVIFRHHLTCQLKT